MAEYFGEVGFYLFLIGFIYFVARWIRVIIHIRKKIVVSAVKEIRLFILCTSLFVCFICFTQISHNKKNYNQNQVKTADVIKDPKVDAKIKAKCAILIETDTGTIIYEKNSHEKKMPASTVKILTALTVLKYCSLEEMVTFGEEVNYVQEDASRADLKPGETASIKTLLEGLLLPSGNDAAYVLAVYTGKKLAQDSITTIDATELFIYEMNKFAKKLGAKNTKIRNPDGYDNEGQYSTAYDIGLIGMAAINQNIIREIAEEESVTVVFNDGREVVWNNSNELIKKNGAYYYENAIGLKTGSTKGAGKCMVAAADINHHTYVCVVLDSVKEYRWKDCITIFDLVSEQKSN